jgi:hypothetical protein
MPKKPLPEKVLKEMHRFYELGYTYEEIGSAFGEKIRGRAYTRQHVRKLIQDYISEHKLTDSRKKPSRAIRPRIKLGELDS